MADFFSKMNADYVQKHFPDGSVFAGAMKTVKRRSLGGLIVFGLFLAAALCGLVWGIGRTLRFVSDGEDDMLSVGIVICGFFGVIVLLCLVALFFLIKGSRQKRGDYIADSAKHSKLPVSEIETFSPPSCASAWAWAGPPCTGPLRRWSRRGASPGRAKPSASCAGRRWRIF